jgi:hypothetical protein
MFQIRAMLADTGRVSLWRNNTGFDRERRIKYGLGLGGADLVGLIDGGRFVAFEIKTPIGRVSKDQILWANAVRARGGFVAVVRSVDDAALALARAESGASE